MVAPLIAFQLCPMFLSGGFLFEYFRMLDFKQSFAANLCPGP